jgi:hypothetical protein
VIADISSGNTGFADVMFLLAVFLFVIGAVVAWAIEPRALWATAASLGLAAVSLGWLVL